MATLFFQYSQFSEYIVTLEIISFYKNHFQKPLFNFHQILKIRQIQTWSEFFGKLKCAKNKFLKYKEIAIEKTRELPQNKKKHFIFTRNLDEFECRYQRFLAPGPPEIAFPAKAVHKTNQPLGRWAVRRLVQISG